MYVLPRSNDALIENPPAGNFHLVTHGSDWLWAVDAVYIISLLCVAFWTYFARTGEKIFHYLFTISLFVGSIAYFAMAADLGWTIIATADQSPGSRQIFYARYINWFVGWVPLLIAVGLISGVSWATIIFNIGLQWIWIASWLSGALVSTTWKWGFFTFGLVSEILLWVSLIYNGSVTSERIGVRKHFFAISGWVTFLWLLYPILYGVDDGGNVIGVTSGFIFAGILDVLLIPVTAFGILLLSNRWDYRNMNIYFTQYGRVAQGGAFPEREKEAPATAPAEAPAPATV